MKKNDVLTLANMGFTKAEIVAILADKEPKKDTKKEEKPDTNNTVSKADFETFKEEIRGMFRDGARGKEEKEDVEDILTLLIGADKEE